MAMQYRQVPCTYQPQYNAPTSPEPTPYYGDVPGGSLVPCNQGPFSLVFVYPLVHLTGKIVLGIVFRC